MDFDFSDFTSTASKREEPERKQEIARPGFSRTSDIDAELEELLSKKKACIKVVGVGGAGNNSILRMSDVGIKGAELIAANTDAQDLLTVIADKKILLGKEITSGLGAGADPSKGEEAAKESATLLKKAIEGADMVFITCGLGGGTGTGAAPVIAEIAKKHGSLTVGVVTLPFSMEGNQRYNNAVKGLNRLQDVVDTLIVIPNDKLLEIAPDLPMQTAFKVADEILTNAVKGIAELVTKPGLINLDFADIKAVMSDGGVAMIGVGESDTEHRAIEAVEKAITNPLLDVEITGATGAMINVTGGENMTLEEARQVVRAVSERLDPEAKIIWGASVSKDLQDTIRAMLIVTGVKSTQIFGGNKTYTSQKIQSIEDELGIKFLKTY
ncbi:MAG: cell division protein FtsZ [Candidatus Nanoarchaeia archaeon]|nr:cell division protein FtsZ [Candidatus Nanoarchaeia archaeon]